MKTNTNSESDLKNRIAQHSKQLPKIDFNRRRRNRGLSVGSLLSVIHRESAEFWNGVEVVGKWVWIQFDGKQQPQTTAALSELGFHWNNRRQVWQHPCGTVTATSNRDPHRTYRSYFPSDQKPA
jgi:hypothetical protein